jgi:hypothetical protein
LSHFATAQRQLNFAVLKSPVSITLQLLLSSSMRCLMSLADSSLA